MSSDVQNLYGIVLDAGSSHTAMYVYRWPSDKQNGTGVVTQHTECHAEGGGISSYAGQKGAVGGSLEACLNQAMQDIPKSRHHLTPVYLGATAGMRLLNMSNPGQSDQVLQEVAHKIQSYPFNYRGAAILSGQEEGAYGWITVNYLLENLIKNNTCSTVLFQDLRCQVLYLESSVGSQISLYSFVGRWQSLGRATVGALDFGGASTQITFVTQDKVEEGQDLMRLRLYGQEYSLYSHSFLCYGQDQVLKRILAHLITSQGQLGSVFHPCYPVGYNTTMKLETVFDSSCTMHQKPSSYNSQNALTVVGTGHYDHCLGNVSQIFSFDRCQHSQCSFDGVYQPNVTGSFMAFSAFFYIHEFLQSTSGITVSTPAQLEKATRIVCSLSFSQMSALVLEQKSRMHHYCGSAVFTKLLMLRGYGFDEHSFPRVFFQKKAGDTSVGWALGYMLSLSSLLPEESLVLRKALRPEAWVGLLFLLALLLAAALAFISLQACRQKRKGSGDSNVL